MANRHALDRYRDKLHALRSRLDGQAAELRDEACHGAGGDNVGDLSTAPIHPGDVGGQETEAVVNLALAENEASLRREIDEALLRFDNGTFGSCEECRGKIDPERLEAIPYSRLCIRCAKRNRG